MLFLILCILKDSLSVHKMALCMGPCCVYCMRRVQSLLQGALEEK